MFSIKHIADAEYLSIVIVSSGYSKKVFHKLDKTIYLRCLILIKQTFCIITRILRMIILIKNTDH